jgi:hypothetical protein
LVDFTISIIANLSDKWERYDQWGDLKTDPLKMEEVVNMMEVYLGERQQRMNAKDILKQRAQLRNVPPKDLKDGLAKFVENQQMKKNTEIQQQAVKKDISLNFESIRATAIKAKEIDVPLVADLFTLEECMENGEPIGSAMKSVLEKLVLKYGEDEYWMKSLGSAIEMIGWMSLNEDGIVDILKGIIKETKYSLSIQIYAAETLFKLGSDNKSDEC